MFMGEKWKYVIVLSIAILIAGCVSTPQEKATPAPTGTPAATATVSVTPTPTPGFEVRILNAPATANVSRSFEVSWRVNSPSEMNITHTAVHYGPESKSEPLTLQSYPSLTTPKGGVIPADFNTSMVINRTGITYFRAHAIIEGTHYWSNEMMITIVGANITATPTVKATSSGGGY